MVLIYLHGFNSSGTGATAKSLKEVYGEHFISFDYDYINPDLAFEQINGILIECFLNKKEPVLIGSSLGGFWANYFAEKYNIKCVLINPSLSPGKSLGKYLGENKNFSTGKKHILHESHLLSYEKFESNFQNSSSVMKTVLLGAMDEKVNYKNTALLMKEHKVVIDKTMGHRLTEVSKLISLIDETVYSYAEEILEENVLNEHVINLLPQDKKGKLAYVDEVWKLLIDTYAKLGGLHGNGFNSKEEMIEIIPFWKLVKRHDKIVAVAMYKDKNGRKRVAAATDGTIEGKKAFAMMGSEDLRQKRAYAEISGPSLLFIKKQMKDEFINAIIPYGEVSKIIDDHIQPPPPDDAELLKHPELKNYFYQREIGGHWKTKIMLGTPGNTI